MSDDDAGSSGAGPATVSGEVEVAAPPERVWALVSDLPEMGRFSPEAAGGRWVRGGPVVGGVFRGTNAQGRRTWSTRSTVVEAEAGRRFAFEVASLGLPVARWTYDITPTPSGCRVVETWEDRRGGLVRRAGALLTGVQDRSAFTATSIQRTLQRVKAHAEAGGDPGHNV